MQFSPQILIHQLDYILPNNKLLFNRLNLIIAAKKTALIGNNGLGKSTLLKLINHELKPNAGNIESYGKIAYLPQDFRWLNNSSVAEVLGVKIKLDALARIMSGSTDQKDFDDLQEDWMIQERLHALLTSFGLAHLNLHQSIKALSGGEITRLILLQVFNSDADILLLDEPSNNLDASARQLLYQQIKQWPGLIVIVSHDRELLMLMDQIVELTPLGVQSYGGNYEHYLVQKELLTAAAWQHLQHAKKQLHQAQQSIQASYEKHDQRRAKGEQLRKQGKIDKISANSAQGRSERSQHRMVIHAEKMLQDSEQALQTAKADVIIQEEIKVDLPKTIVANDKIILSIEALSFTHKDSVKPLIQNFDFILQGPERIALMGNNGTGKTTLIKLILRELFPVKGTVALGTEAIKYLDQQASLLLPELSVLENFLYCNPTVSEQDARHRLAQFLFKNTQALKLAKDLSGGERVRAALACILLSDHPPQLLILDEPTNHLDLSSMHSIESAINCYQGALIVISHDLSFLQNIHIQRVIQTPLI